MLFLPLEEDSLLFRLCLYYGLIVLLLELLMPLFFQCRMRIEIPRLALRAPAVPLSTREFQQRRLALQQQVAALQRALAETPRRSPQKRRQRSSPKNRPAASPSPSLASPTSSVTRSSFSRKKSNGRKENEVSRPPLADHLMHKSVPSPMAMGDFLATRAVRRGGFSFNDMFEDKENGEKKKKNLQKDRDDWMQAVNIRMMRRRESPTFSGRRPVRFVSEDADGAGYVGVPVELSEAATRLETLIGARKRQRASTSQSCVLPTPPSNSVPLSVTALVAPVEKVLEHNELNLPAREVSPRQQDEGKPMEEDEVRKELEQSEPLTDFQAFCASFAAGGSAAAQRAVAKRKHHEAFGSVNKQMNGSATTLQFLDRLKHPRTLGQDMKEPNGDNTAETPHSVDKRTRYEAFGSDDKQAIDDAIVTRQVLEKRKHDQSFGTTKQQEQPDEKTPRIARRISFGDEVSALVDPSSKEMPGRHSNGKRKRTQAFGMQDEDDEDTVWRDSLAFRPHRSRLAK